MLIEFVSNQSGLKFRAEESISIATVAQHEKVESKYGHIDDDRPTNKTQDTCKEMLSNHFLKI